MSSDDKAGVIVFLGGCALVAIFMITLAASITDSNAREDWYRCRRSFPAQECGKKP